VPQAATAAIGAELERLALPHWRIGEVVAADDGDRVRIG
jgi:phosphoribosylformylglycinamidine cyclo-ligase